MTLKPPVIPSAPLASGQPTPPISSQDILRGLTSVPIEHAGQYYVLRVTRENKLILTK